MHDMQMVKGTGWDCAVFPKFLESRCGLREVEG